MRLFRFLAVLTVFALLSVVGCAGTSPAVGIWAGNVVVGSAESVTPADPMGMATMMLGSMLSGPCTLQLNAGGQGFIKVASLPERPISWSEQEDKVILRSDEPPPANTSNVNAQSNTIVGTLAPDKQTMTLDFGVASAELKKQ